MIPFIHIPKTGGVSICDALGIKVKGHQPSEGAGFCFMRDPAARVASAYNFLKAGGRNRYNEIDRDKYIGNLTLDEFVWLFLREASEEQVHFRPQVHWLGTGIDHIGRYEHLQEDFDMICKIEGIPTKELPHLNSSTGSVEIEDMDMIREIYEEDYALYEKLPLFGHESYLNCIKQLTKNPKS